MPLIKTERPVALRVNKEDGYWLLDHEDCTIPTREEWIELRTMVDALYDQFDDREIDEYNQGIRHARAEKLALEFQAQESLDPRDEPTPGFIYLIHGEGTAWYKIGLSIHPNLRVKQLGTRSPFPLVIVDCFDVDDMESVEAWWHETFAHKRKYGEWFELDEPDIDLFVAQEGRPIL